MSEVYYGLWSSMVVIENLIRSISLSTHSQVLSLPQPASDNV